MEAIKRLIEIVFGKKEVEDGINLDSRIEFRLNKKEKMLINQYCKYRNISVSKFLRQVSIGEIDKFIIENN